ncbi:3-hydroxyacyl-CoA dehydrogenase NAD-binding domain-containing protein [Stutzerimonas tarimensis]|uniref:3-hydroxyacyl-CoA dehydrogenase NAD-binding domain-containing protein n=1 Tax=Stutzerimonas tarimensis TaxID=1507735 RepID=A0ABV7TD81_9GAMM
MADVVRIEQREAITFVIVDNPPVNALSFPVRQGLWEALAAAEADLAQEAVVLVGAGAQFLSGADIREFGRPSQSPTLPELAVRIAAMSKPCIAAIRGAALGGGLELAMACHYRLAEQGARLGLPEVTLGLLPGAGGTQRLPRLVGVPLALEMIVHGAPIPAPQGLEAGLVDAVFHGDALEAAFRFVKEQPTEALALRRTDDRSDRLAGDHAGLFEAVRADLARRKPHLFAPQRAIEAVEAATGLPMADGLAREKALFAQCRASPQSAALIHRFFAERTVRKIAGLSRDVTSRPVTHAAVVGGGTMGVGIALSFANAGIPVKLVEVDKAALGRALQRAQNTYAASVRHGSLDAESVERRMALIEGVTDYAALADVDLVVEAVFEDVEVKRQVFQRLDAVCRPGAILATNTSSLNFDEIAAFTRRPEAVVGLHFFAPANVMPLLEVVRGARTSDDTLATAMALGRRLKKTAVVVGVCDGFVGNRMLFQYGREAEFLLEEGATPQQVDDALRRFGMAMGPFAVRDLSGLDVGLAIRRRQRAHAPAHLRWPTISDRLCAAGMFGQKTGAGYYRYEGGSRTPQENPDLLPMLEAASQDRGIERRLPDEALIIERTIFALINEGAKILEEGIAQRASDIDAIFINGYGFPAWRGGPMFYADQLGLDRVLERIRAFHAEHGDWWAPAPLLERAVAGGGTLTDWQPDRPAVVPKPLVGASL